jgi:hypothetical protein
VRKILWSSEALDATLALIDPVLKDLESFPIARVQPDPEASARMYVVGHPLGGQLSLSLNDNLLLDREEPRLHYRSPTEPGSSGSPVFDQDWNLVGLHHAGSLMMPRLRGRSGVYRANEGISIHAIQRAAQATRP